MPFIIKRHTLAVLSCFATASVFAQTNTIPSLDNIVVTPGRMIQSEQDVIGDITVIDHETLQKAGSDSVADILGRQPGVQFSSQGGPQTVTSVFLRGTAPQQTLVLLDGMRINGNATGSIAWNAIDPAMVERIEIVRGAASSLYGSNALGGVINIITKKDGDRPLSAWANVGMGTYDTFKTSAGISGAAQGWDYALAASKAQSEGFNATNRHNAFGYNADKDGYDQHALSGSLGYRWAPGQHIGLTAYNGYINGDYDAGEFSHPAYSLTRQQAYTLTSTNEITSWWESVLRYGFSKDYGESRYGTDSAAYGTLQRNYAWQNNFALGQNQKLGVILERLEERPRATSSYTTNRRNTNSVGLTYRGDFGPHHLQASVRNDDITGYGDETTGGLGYDFDLDPHWTIGLAGNTGFRAPTFADMYSPLNWGFQGNPDLKPEKSRNIEAHIQYATDTTRIGLVAYQNKIRNLIEGYVCDPVTWDCTAKNVDDATIRGLTLTASQQFGNTTLHASADFMRPRNNGTGKQLIRRAKQVYNLSADHRIGAFNVGAEYQFIGKRYEDVDNTVSLGGYGLFNLTGAYEVSKNVAVQVRWNNVFDKYYQNAYGYNMPGSSVFVNFALKM
ncbi:TonB-dependent receptor domain-containing protein [Pusillimonas sp. ANT_WB101]|uniref:TonB-dependent receptor domain-containing protein n=1 Tax=Pusillimonas sp. ANT_WB101 TaxID=2597356 RepID=UPI0011EE61C5|nr:TonB-dependent receptor [Pusillimonas sp. ANT_WB101]KAA0890679.1 TonB-dependent receptor [Pusillimonas sp. ANT_WB101]